LQPGITELFKKYSSADTIKTNDGQPIWNGSILDVYCPPALLLLLLLLCHKLSSVVASLPLFRFI